MIGRSVLLLCSLLLSGTCVAASTTSNQSGARFTEGDEYVAIESPQRYADDGKVEVAEVFSYACIHCAHFAPYMDDLVDALPDDVSVHYVPAIFNRRWEPFARAYIAARKLGVVDTTHDALFQARFSKDKQIKTLPQLADFYAAHGVDRDKFLKAAKSSATRQKMIADFRLARQWGVNATPTIVVDGKYRSNNIQSFDELVALTKWLVDYERQHAEQ